MAEKKSKESSSKRNIAKEGRSKRSDSKNSNGSKPGSRRAPLSSSLEFIQYLNKYGTDFTKFVLPPNINVGTHSGAVLDDIARQRLLQESYEDYMKVKSRFVNKRDTESNISEIQSISRGANPDTFKAKVVLEGKKKIQNIVDLEENDYRLPFLLKDLEFRLKQQLSYVKEMYSSMIVLGIIDAKFLEDDMVFESCEPKDGGNNKGEHGRFLPADFREKLQLNSTKANINKDKAKSAISSNEQAFGEGEAGIASSDQIFTAQYKGGDGELAADESVNTVHKDILRPNKPKITVPLAPSNKLPLASKQQKQSSTTNKGEQQASGSPRDKDTQPMQNSAAVKDAQSMAGDIEPAAVQGRVESAKDAQSNIEGNIDAPEHSGKSLSSNINQDAEGPGQDTDGASANANHTKLVLTTNESITTSPNKVSLNTTIISQYEDFIGELNSRDNPKRQKRSNELSTKTSVMSSTTRNGSLKVHLSASKHNEETESHQSASEVPVNSAQQLKNSNIESSKENIGEFRNLLEESPEEIKDQREEGSIAYYLSHSRFD